MQQSGSKAGPGHRVQPRAVGLAHDDRDLRHGRLADGADHLGAVADDALALDLRADHEAGHVGEEQQRHVERVARPDEARGLVGGVDEQHAALVLGLVGDDPDRAAVEAREADDQLLAPSAAGSRSSEPSSTSASISSFMSNGLFSSAGISSAMRRALAGARRRGRGGAAAARSASCSAGRRGSARAGAMPSSSLRDQLMRAAGDAGVHARAAHLLERHLLADHHLGHARRAEVHGGVALAHDHDVAERRDVGAAGGARAEQDAHLRHDARTACTWLWKIRPAPRRPGNICTCSVMRAPAESTR